MSRKGEEERSMGSGVGSTLLLVALLTFAPCALASSRKIDLNHPQPNLRNFTDVLASSVLNFPFDPSKSKRLSWHPRVFLYEGFLSDKECDHLISMARGKIKPSSAVDGGAKNSSQNNTETDLRLRVYLADSKDAVISKIEERISLWSFLPKEYGENMQILQYGVNKSYGSHVDHYEGEPHSGSGGYRLVTVLMYLSDVKRGGETVFPKSELKDAQVKEGASSECAGYMVKPVKGNAILLFNLKPDGKPDEDSQHQACPVLEGEKWFARKYIHLRKFDTPKSSLASEDECTDEDDRCVNWAAAGECDRNPVFMIGSPDYYGTCQKSCGVC